MTLRTITNGRLVNGEKIDNLPDDVNAELAAKQDTLVSGTNIKTINGSSILGSGNITIAAGGGDVTAASAFGTDNRIIRSDGTGKGVQASGITIDDSDNITGINNVTGLDTNLVTGTAGTNGNLASWNTDGDVVDFSMATNRILGRNTAGSGVAEELTGATVRDLISLGTSDSPQFAGINVGHATDTTITRDSAGVIAVEGVVIPSISSTDTLSNKTLAGVTMSGDIAAGGNNINNLGNITFQTGATGGTLRTGTSNADKFVLQAYDVNDGTYRTLIEADAGNDVVLQLIADYLKIEDATDTSKEIQIDLSGATTSTITTLVSSQTANRSITLPDATDTLVGRATTDTLTNKRITPRVGTTTSSATPTINTDNVDMYILTAQAADITSFTTNLSGTPTNGQKLWIAITGTAARAITRGASFENGAVDLPTTTITTQRLDVGFVWNAATSKRRCMAAGPLS